MTALEDRQAEELIQLRAQRDALLEELEEARLFIEQAAIAPEEARVQEVRMVGRIEDVRKGRGRT